MENFLEFEKSLMQVARRIDELKSVAGSDDLPEKDIPGEIKRLETKLAKLTRLLYRELSPWQKVQVARHGQRPQVMDYINSFMTDFVPLSGDRNFADDHALVGGLARLDGEPIAVLGIQKGRSTSERVKNNFGMVRPEGYRKAQRIMNMANKFKLPLITFVDTPGAYPGVGAEARGQSEAIAKSIETMLSIDVPIITVITGEGGSGGALAIAVADKVLMLEYSVYSVISPEGCASILWKEANKDTIPTAAEALNMTAQDLERLGIIDGIIKEPVGGAHRDPEVATKRVHKEIQAQLKELIAKNGKKSKSRRQKFLALTRG